MKILSFIIASFFFTSLSAQTVRLSDTTNPAVRYSSSSVSGSGTIYTINTTAPSDSIGNTSGAPTQLFLPLNDSGNTSQSFHISPNRTSLPTSTSGTFLQVDVLVTNNSGSSRELYIAVQDSSTTDFEVVATPITIANGVSSNSLTLTPTIAQICNVSGLSCPTGTSDDVSALMFVYQDVVGTHSVGANFDPSAITDGLFFNLNMSSSTSALSAITVTQNELRRGDQALVSVFSSSVTSITESDQVVAISGASIGSTSIGASGGVVINEGSYPFNTSGEVTIGGLTNGTTVSIAVALADRYGFASNISNVINGTPEEIQQFLNEESCYLLSSGFQEKHYVIDYFKHIRDDYLLHHPIGKKFVNLYYSTAPKYTHFIYRSKFLSLIVRSLGYLGYYIFNYFLWIIGGLTGYLLIHRSFLSNYRYNKESNI